MRQSAQKVGTAQVCRLFGKSRQAYYQAERRRDREDVDEAIVLEYVREIRARQPRLGGRKLYSMLKDVMVKSSIKMGRDKFFTVLRSHGLLVKPRRRRMRTTDSSHAFQKYPNLVKDYEAAGPEQIWSSDITYVSTEQGFVYVSLVTDNYSRKIMGYHAHATLEAAGPVTALKMALQNRRHPETSLIHHSDRGVQYCCDRYVNLLKNNNIQISMSAAGNPYENAIAERVNGIVKTEFYLDGFFKDINQVRRNLRETVAIYNRQRPHASCDYLTPYQAHLHSGPLKKRWRHYKRNTKSLHRIDDEATLAVSQLLRKQRA